MNRQDAAKSALFSCIQCDHVSEGQTDFCSEVCRATHFDENLTVWVQTDPRLRTAMTTHQCQACGEPNENSNSICQVCGTPWDKADEWKNTCNDFHQQKERGLIEDDLTMVEWLINDFKQSPEFKTSPLAREAIEDHLNDQRRAREDLALSVWLNCATDGLPIALGEHNAKANRIKHILSTLFVGLSVAGALLGIGWKLVLAETGFWGNLIIEICAWGVALTVAGSGWRLNRLFRNPDPRTFRTEMIQSTRRQLLVQIANWGKV